jgi:hypothetical protein
MTRTYRRSDAEKLELLVRVVGKWRMKAALTVPDVLIALRYECNKGEFEDYCAEADELVRGYYGYKDVIEPEED